MGVPTTIDNDEVVEHIEYCVDLFLNAHKVS